MVQFLVPFVIPQTLAVDVHAEPLTQTAHNESEGGRHCPVVQFFVPFVMPQVFGTELHADPSTHVVEVPEPTTKLWQFTHEVVTEGLAVK